MLGPTAAPTAVLLVVRQGPEVPFPEMPRRVALFLEQLGERHLLVANMTGVRGRNSVAIRMAPGQGASSGRGADRGPRIEPVEAQADLAHGVKVGRLQEGVPVVAGVAPALVVGHAENHIRPAGA